MVRQAIHLPSYRWDILVYYWARKKNAREILQTLQRFGASDETLLCASHNLNGIMVNTGLTYTNDDMRTTVMVISRTSSPEEFWNTLDHEKGHAAQHIGAALNLDYTSEAQQYLAGEIAEQMYPVAKEFICDC